MAKIFDSIITSKLTDFILPQIIRNQHGFVTGKSVVTNLLLFIKYVPNSLNNHYQVDVAFMDFSKAFDSIEHT